MKMLSVWWAISDNWVLFYVGASQTRMYDQVSWRPCHRAGYEMGLKALHFLQVPADDNVA